MGLFYVPMGLFYEAFWYIDAPHGQPDEGPAAMDLAAGTVAAYSYCCQRPSAVAVYSHGDRRPRESGRPAQVT
jgi:hypothetical protein